MFNFKLLRTHRYVLMVSAICAFTSCDFQQPAVRRAVDVIIIDDRAAHITLHPLTASILDLYEFSRNKDRVTFFRIVPLADIKRNPTQVTTTPETNTSGNGSKSDISHNEYEVANFSDWVDHLIHRSAEYSYFPENNGGKRPECYTAIVAELSNLANSSAVKRVLIVYSDLHEQNELFNCDSRSGRKAMYSNPSSIAKKFLEAHPLPVSLVGVTVYFVFDGRNSDEGESFEAMVDVYRRLLQERGARVVVQNTNAYFQP